MHWPNRGRKQEYVTNILLGFDQLTGTFFGIDCDESISSYIGRTRMGSFLQKTIDTVFLVLTGVNNHCLNSIERSFVTAEMAAAPRGDADAQ